MSWSNWIIVLELWFIELEIAQIKQYILLENFPKNNNVLERDQ